MTTPSTNTIIKHAPDLTAQELYNILQLRNAVFIVELDKAIQDADGEDLLPSVYQLMSTTPEGRCVGHLRLHISEDLKTAHVRRVVVAKDFRGKALGREIMSKAIEWCKSFGISKMTMGARAHLQKFYGSFGFVPVGDLYFHEEVEVWHRDMEMSL